MASKALPDEMSKHVAREFEAWVQQQNKGRPKPLTQFEIAERLELPSTQQPQVSEWLKGKALGVNALLTISRATGRSINELLGPTAPQVAAPDDNAVIDLMQCVAEMVAEMAASQVSDQRVLNKWGEMRAKLAKLPKRFAPRVVDMKTVEEARRQKRMVASDKTAAKVARPAKRKAAGQ